MEATARLLFVHPNTVRYRLRRVAELTGFSPVTGRGGFTLWVAVVLGRLAAPPGLTRPAGAGPVPAGAWPQYAVGANGLL